MDDKKAANRIHPLVAGAAVSVMLVSLIGIAAITGLIPNSHSSAAPSADMKETAVATSPTGLTDTKENADTGQPSSRSAAPQRDLAPRTAQKNHSPRTSYANSEPAKVAQAPSACISCGIVESVNTVQQQANPSGLGMVAGAVLGGVLGNQVGGGNGRKLATVAGAVGGGYAGNEVEKRTGATTSYQVLVRMEDGRVRSFSYETQPGWNVGDRVRVVDGRLSSRA